MVDNGLDYKDRAKFAGGEMHLSSRMDSSGDLFLLFETYGGVDVTLCFGPDDDVERFRAFVNRVADAYRSAWDFDS